MSRNAFKNLMDSQLRRVFRPPSPVVELTPQPSEGRGRTKKDNNPHQSRRQKNNTALQMDLER